MFFFIFFLFGIFETRQTNMKTRSQTKLQTTTEPVVAEKDFFEILQRNYGEQYKVADCSQMNHFELLNYLEKNRTQLDVISFVKRNERNDLYFQVTNLLSLVQARSIRFRITPSLVPSKRAISLTSWSPKK